MRQKILFSYCKESGRVRAKFPNNESYQAFIKEFGESIKFSKDDRYCKYKDWYIKKSGGNEALCLYLFSYTARNGEITLKFPNSSLRDKFLKFFELSSKYKTYDSSDCIYCPRSFKSQGDLLSLITPAKAEQKDDDYLELFAFVLKNITKNNLHQDFEKSSSHEKPMDSTLYTWKLKLSNATCNDGLYKITLTKQLFTFSRFITQIGPDRPKKTFHATFEYDAKSHTIHIQVKHMRYQLSLLQDQYQYYENNTLKSTDKSYIMSDIKELFKSFTQGFLECFDLVFNQTSNTIQHKDLSITDIKLQTLQEAIFLNFSSQKLLNYYSNSITIDKLLDKNVEKFSHIITSLVMSNSNYSKAEKDYWIHVLHKKALLNGIRNMDNKSNREILLNQYDEQYQMTENAFMESIYGHNTQIDIQELFAMVGDSISQNRSMLFNSKQKMSASKQSEKSQILLQKTLQNIKEKLLTYIKDEQYDENSINQDFNVYKNGDTPTLDGSSIYNEAKTSIGPFIKNGTFNKSDVAIQLHQFAIELHNNTTQNAMTH